MPSVSSLTRHKVNRMAPSCYLPESNPLLVCDPEPHGWVRKDLSTHSDYVSMEELITYNNLRLAKYRDEHSINSLHNLDAKKCTNIRTVAEAEENRMIASRRADVVRATRGEASPHKNSSPDNFTQRRNVQGLRNRASFFAKKEGLEECQRDYRLQQDAVSWHKSINKALPQIPSSSHHQRNTSEESKTSNVASSNVLGHFHPSSSKRVYDNQNHAAFPADNSTSEYYPKSIVNYPNSLDFHNNTIQKQQTESTSKPLSEDLKSQDHIDYKLLETLKDSTDKAALGEFPSDKPVMAQKVNNFLYRSNSLPVNVTPMSERQKYRLEMFRESTSINGTSQADRLPHHVAIARSRTFSQLNSTSKAEELRFTEHQLTRSTNKASDQSKSYAGKNISIPSQTALRQLAGTVTTTPISDGNEEEHKAAHSTVGFINRAEVDGAGDLCQLINQCDYPKDRSTSTLVMDGIASIEQNPLTLQGGAGSPSKKIVEPKADTKPVLKSIWDSMKSRVQLTKTKMDLAAFKEIFIRSRDPASGMTISNFMISCDQEFQSSLYAQLDLIICTVANKFLLFEYYAHRITTDTAARYIESWVGKGRAQFTEFNCGQPFQALIIWECREALHFYSCQDNRLRDGVLDTWRKNANSMSVLTRCNGDSAIQKHLHDSWKVLEMLGGTWDDFESLSRLHISFHEVVAVAKTRNDALGILHDWNPPPVPETPAMASIKSPDLSYWRRQS